MDVAAVHKGPAECIVTHNYLNVVRTLEMANILAGLSLGA